MLKYKINVIAELRKAGYSTYRIRNEKIFTEAQLQHLRRDHLLTHDAFDKLCNILNCQPGDLIEHIPDDPDLPLGAAPADAFRKPTAEGNS